MATYSDNFNRADANLSSPWAAVVGAGGAIVSNEAKAASGSGYRISALTGETFDNDQDAEVTINAVNTSDYAGPAVRFDGSGNGYFMSCQFIDGRVYLFRFDAGVQTSLGYISSTPVATDRIKLGVVGSTFTYYLNDVSQGTWNDATYSGGAPGIGFNPGGSNSTTLDLFNAEGFVSGPSLDDVDTDEIVLDGQTAVALTYSNFTNPIDSAVLKSGSHESAMTNLSAGASSATADMPDVTQYSSVTAGCPYTTASNAVTVDIENSGDEETASLAVTRDPPSGWVAQELTSAVKTSGSVCKAFTGTIPDTSIIAYPTASTTAVSATGILTTNITSGSISMVYWDATAGTWQPFLVIMSGSEFSIQILGSAVIGTAIKATAIAGASL